MLDVTPEADAGGRARGALLGLAVGDALGAPVEFKERDTFPEVREMLAGGYFHLPAGAWTDDTAMALCLADSLLHDSELDVGDLLDRFVRWAFENEYTSTGRCVGVGQNTFAVLGNYRRTRSLVAPPVKGRSDGNGALMRLAPIACRHWRSPAKAAAIARAQSVATHASDLSAASCDVLATMLCRLICGQPWPQVLAQADVNGLPLELATMLGSEWHSKPREAVRSSGYVRDTLEAAIWALDTTHSFEEALILAVNLGHDADTVGAVAGQLAGARYGIDAIPERWLRVLHSRPEIERRASDLILAASLEHRQGCDAAAEAAACARKRSGSPEVSMHYARRH